MKRKNVMKTGIFLTIIGFATLLGLQANSSANFFMESIEGRSPTPQTTPEEYDGPQTVQALMKAYDAEYNRRFSKTRVIASRKDGGVYSSELAISGEIDMKYPRKAWLHLLLDRGIIIENFRDYRVYLSKRHTLVFLEDHPDLRKSRISDILPTDDWETCKAAYIDKLVAKRIERSEKQIERVRKQIERAKKQSNSQEIEHFRKQLEDAKKQLKRLQEALEHSKERIPTPNVRKRFPPL